MTNENKKKALQIKDDEKAEIIAYRLSYPLRCERCGAYIWEATDNADTAFKAAMKMAKWKDEDAQAERQALIDRACEWWEDEFTFPEMTQENMSCKENVIEYFKQAMKEGEQ